MADPSSRYLVPCRPHRVEEVVQKSRFITDGTRASSQEEAHSFIESVRREFPDATHHCWAFVAGPPGDTASIGMSDDGEPHGTAGRPMLTTLVHGGVGEIVAVCTRYFGGTKLGTGGLSRAYSGGVKLLLESLPTELRIDRIPLLVTIDYGSVDALQRALAELEAEVQAEDYGERVVYEIALPQEFEEALVRAVAGMTKGSGIVRVL
jgi:uncharacterized YigZ family protein